MVVLVGPDEEKIYVHKAIFGFSSDFLKNILKPQWKKGGRNSRTTEIALPDVHPASFRIYVNWLYTSRFNIIDKTGGTQQLMPKGSVTTDHDWTTLRQCFELADFLQDSDYKDALIDLFIQKMTDENKYFEELPNFIYPLTHAQSPARKLAVDVAVKMWNVETYQRVGKADYPAEFLADVVTKLGSRIRFEMINEHGADVFFEDVECEYHEHTLTNSLCYKVKRGL